MKTKRHIQTLVFTLLLLLVGGMTNGATVTYHILTIPFSVHNATYSGYKHTNIRLEALRCTSTATTVGLPDAFKSPLATNFKYYTAATSTYTKLWDNDTESHILPTKYDIYSAVSGEISAGADVDENTDIYVTYDYVGSNDILELDGTKNYNIPLNTGSNMRYLCLNQDRKNRPGAALATKVSATDLVSDDFVTNTDGGLNKKTVPIHLQFKFLGNDPYNITIMSAYDGDETYAEKLGDEAGTYLKTYKGSSIFAKLNNNNDNDGTANMWLSPDDNKHYKNTTKVDYDQWEGFYRITMNPIFNAVAILPHNSTGYVFVASKLNQNGTVYQPNDKGYYAYLNDNGNNPRMIFRAASSATPIPDIYEIKTYTVHIKTHGATGADPTTLTATMKWSDAMLNENPANHVPEALKRKYVTYKAYSDAGLNNEITKFSQVTNQEYWLDYTVSESSMPFETLSNTGNYQDARWYTMRMNGKAEAKNIAYKAESSNAFITSPTKGDNTNQHTGENSAEAMVAFMGDPYELKILNRKACENASANSFIGSTAATEGTVLTTNNDGTSGITTWEIAYDTESGNFVLREFGTAATTPMYIGWGTDGSKSVTYSSISSRIRVVELAQVDYTYYIVRNGAGDIAVKASSTHDVGKMLRSWEDIPAVIRSPFLAPSYTATVTYYASLDDAKDEENAITNAPYDYSTADKKKIYVRYAFDNESSAKPSAKIYNVRVYNQYIYTTSDNAILYKSEITGGEAGTDPYQWTFDFSDPYAMTVKNSYKNSYITTDSDGNITWSGDVPTKKFIAKSGASDGTYEVMAATGGGDSDPDASTTYYNIGRDNTNGVKQFSNSTYQYGNEQLRFEFSAPGAHEVTYHLVDMSNKKLLDVKVRQAETDNIAFPAQYRSPLVDTYSYFPTLDDAKEKTNPIDITTTKVNASTEFFVTYNVNDLIDLKAKQLYLMKYEAGQYFKQEDGSDGVNPTAQKAIYPYVNGDGNFFVYGQEQYNLQQEGASSTRTRWAWYVESDAGGKGDPYHVKIKSRQTELYPIVNYSEYNAYFMTYKPDDYSQVITTLGWPGMNSETATEYMILGSEGQYQLVTTNTIPIDLNTDGDTEDEGENVRYVVDSFEQYWKTFDTIKKKIYGSSKEDDDDPIIIPNDVTKGGKTLRAYLEEDLRWHSYEKWAYAKRWNGYNNGYSSEEGTHEKKKGWEKIEHWYQTVSMGQGYFDFVKTSVNPVLILLDQHGFEIMRKPLPTDPNDPDKTEKYAAIRPYNSPMVKEYAFWATAKKRTGLHQYYALADRIGDDFTSTDLTNLPPYGSKNVKDKKGNLNDQYVTYIVKDEYAQTYTPKTKEGKEFLIEQGSKYASTDGSTITKNDVPANGMIDYITNHAINDTKKWYVKPNATIDIEMGYNDVSHTWTDHDPTDSKKWKNKNPNAYEHYKFKDARVASYISDKVLTDSLGYFSFSNGFDPYNIQIESANVTATYMKTDANGAELNEGSIIGSYPDTPGTIAMGDNTTIIDDPKPKWYDSRSLSVTNATFMAVQDANGNMQLMPRFDHSTRMSEFGTLIAPTDAEVATTYTKLYRPVVYEYLIIDNEGHESLRYKSGGDLTPQTPDHFKSPLATNFGYYATADYNDVTGKYSGITDEIEGSLDGATLTDNKVYVRYEYDEEADDYLKILKGNWLTMQLNGKDAKYDGGIKQGTSKDASQKAWQWKFTESPQSAPDPYALYIFNRSQVGTKQAEGKRFAILSHTEGYALAEAGLGTAENYDYTYNFLNGNSMSTNANASVVQESGFTPTTGSFSGTGSQVKLYNDVTHTFTYKVYTNGGVNAIDATQTQEEVLGNNWQPVLPEAARTPLLNIDQYRYYEQDLSDATPDTINKSLSQLYGLYDDIVYTHYTPYNVQKSSYLVPNVRNDKGAELDPVARGDGSNDTPLGLIGSLLYNFIWYDDYMMKSDGTSIKSDPDQNLQSDAAYEWKLEGNDPYAIKIKSVGSSGNYIHKASETTTNLNAEATTFMLLNREGYDYGVFAVTGDASKMLSGHGNVLTDEAPNHFIPFALATYKVIYHLMIKNIGSEGVIIPFRKANEGPDKIKYTKIKEGTTLRDLTSGTVVAGETYQLGKKLSEIGTEIGGNHTSVNNIFNRDSLYCYDVGPISLGDALEMPQQLSRPNVEYTYYVEGVYNASGAPNDDMDDIYKGLKVDHMGDNAGLLGQVVLINAVYKFMGGLDTNSGSDFVGSVADNKWYTYEANEATTKLAQYTGTLQTVSGYATHYTNDYLWTPVGDPYGFKMYNRYLSKNLGEKMVMSTENIAAENIAMVDDNAGTPYVPHEPAHSVYELLATSTTTPGYFNVHPVVNKDGAQYYMYDNSGTIQLSTTPTEWTFGLSEEVMKPYYQSAGYIGGLNEAGKAAYKEEAEKTNPLERLMGIQDVVYNHDKADNAPDNYIVHYTPGFYRLHSQSGSSGITTPRYMSGYTHKTELTPGTGTVDTPVAIPLHFYEVEEYDMNNPTFGDLSDRSTPDDDFTVTDATRGDIPLVTVTYDPASIFQFTGAAAASPSSTMQTQGLYVKGNKMTATAGEATSFNIIDIGAGIIALQGGDNFLKYAQNEMKYDLKFDNTAETVESARWCMKPVQKAKTVGNGEMALEIATRDGGDKHRYATFYAPFDVLLTDAAKDTAYVVVKWPTITGTTAVMHPKRIGQYNTAENSCPESYRGNDQFIPANTPVIIRTTNTTNHVTAVMPTATPSKSVSCVFTGTYLEQMLAQDAGNLIYVFGRSYTHSGDFTYNSSTGEVTPAGLEFDKGVGFYQNANTNRESNETKTQWSRNNKYVYANKVYYYAGSISNSSLNLDFENTEYIPVLFDDQGVKDMDLQPDGTMRLRINDGRAYDIQGRCVATEQEVSDGSWLNNVASGMYIVNGKKFVIE